MPRPTLALALPAALLLALATLPAGAQTSSVIPGTTCPTFPADSWFHADVSKLPVHTRSSLWMRHMSPGNNLHPDFGPSFGAQPVPYDIPITVVPGNHAKVNVSFDISDQSDHVLYPLGADSQVEGGQWKSGDRHVIMVDSSTCRLYETWATRPLNGKWYAGSGATWDLNSDKLRKSTWTSADAAGLPILPGLLRYDEVARGRIDHAVRFTTDVTDQTFLWPARHEAGSVNDRSYPPMGARFRLKASYQISPSLRADTKAILVAFKRYGLVLADNGSAWFFQGTDDRRWSNDMLDELKRIPASEFEAVDTSSLMVNVNSMQVK
jgi:hypothetical protein